MNAPEIAVIDFESYPIRQRPDYPPVPVGVAIQWPGQQPVYFTHEQKAKRALQHIWDSSLPVLCHNAKFDLAVAYERLSMPRLPWDRVHDTMFLAYLYDPHARSLGLKQLAAALLNWPAEERNELDDWIWTHRAQLEQQYPTFGKVSKKQLGAWIFAAPPEIVGPYAKGDVARTNALFTHLWPCIQNEGMGTAYDRERQFMPIAMENEEQGMRVDVAQLEVDCAGYSRDFGRVEDWLRKALNASGLNFDADQDVANVLLSRGVVPKEQWRLTAPSKTHPEGQLSVSKDNLLPEMFTGPQGAQIASALGYRNRLKTCLTMFMQPWRDQALIYNGHITTNWNQTRNTGKGGTRTGRPSTDKHNILNISKSFDGRDDGYTHPEFLNVPRLPLCRNYILPDSGHEFLHRDFDGQELRVFAHFEQGALWRAYASNPDLDPHAFVSGEIRNLVGRELERTKVKTLNFQGLYGGGAPAAAAKLRCSLAEAREFKAMHDKALPGRKYLNDCIKRAVRTPPYYAIRTWGGRWYRPEKSTVVDGQLKNWEYKLINYLVQGSAADITKQAIIDWYPHRGVSRFMVTVYDEINTCAPANNGATVRAMYELKEAMNAQRLTVPMRSSPKHGPSWGAAKRCPKEKGCALCA